MGRLCAAFLPGALMLAGAPIVAAQPDLHTLAGGDACTESIFDTSGPSNPAQHWSADERYDVSASRRSDGLTDFYITGDVVRLSRETIPSLEPVRGSAATKVGTLTIDARRVVVDMAVALADGHIIIRAEDVTFTRRGSISLTAAPNQRPQLVSILTKNLDFTEARDTPFLFTTADWVGESWPAGDRRRSLMISAQTISPPRDSSEVDLRNLSERPARFIHNLTLDRGRSSRRGMMWAEHYQVRVGVDALDAYHEALRAEMIWPNQTAAKLMSHFGRSPYHRSTLAFLGSIVEQYGPVFAGRSDLSAYTTLVRARTLMDLERDALGLTRFYVPMRTIAAEIEEFARQVDANFHRNTGLVVLWDTSLANSVAPSGPDQAAIARARSSATAAQTEVTRLGGELGDAVTRQAVIAQRIDSVLVRASERQEQLRQEWVAQQRRENDARSIAEIRALLPVAAVAVSALFPAAAPYAMATSQALATTADVAAASLRGGGPLTFRDVFQTFGDVRTEHERYREQANQLGAAWSSVRDKAREAWNNLDGDAAGREVRELAERVAAFGNAARTFQASVPRSGEIARIELSDLERSDEALAAILNDLSKLREEEAQTLATFNRAAERFQILTTEATQQLSLLRELLALRLSNDQALARHRALVASLRRAALADLARSAMMLRRAFHYYTGQALPAPDDVKYFAEEALTTIGLDLVPVDPANLEAELRNQRQAAELAYRALLEAARIGARRYAEAAGARFPDPVLFSASLADLSTDDSLGADPVGEARQARGIFVQSINRQIAQSIAARGPAAEGLPLQIPFVPQPSPRGEPERILGAVITRVDFADGTIPEGRELLFTIEHPGFGWVEFQGCRFVDGGLEQQGRPRALWPTRTPGEQPWETRLVTAAGLGAAFLQSNYPFRAPYYLQVTVPEPEIWDRAPVIQRIEIRFVKFGER